MPGRYFNAGMLLLPGNRCRATNAARQFPTPTTLQFPRSLPIMPYTGTCARPLLSPQG
jgi:hypothetical protein